MLRFSLKDILRGLTLTSIGFGLLAAAFHGMVPASQQASLVQALLVALGGMLIGYGLAFPTKYPPYQMMAAFVGMFAAEAWQSGNAFGILVYLGLTALFFCGQWIHRFLAKRQARNDSRPID
jgi:hypothetical protein